MNMNKNLIIKNFGPIKSVDLEIFDYNIFIGPQATGKSTIAKAVYFFMSLKKDILWYVRKKRKNNNLNRSDFERILRNKFLGFWGSIKVFSSFCFTFRYTVDSTMSLVCNKGYVSVVYSPKMQEDLDGIFAMANNPDASPEQISVMIENLSYLESTAIYIPAGRSILTTLPNSLQQQILDAAISDGSNFRLLDLPLRDFFEQISQLKRIFNKSLHEIIEEKQALAPVSFQLDRNSLEIAQNFINLILKGKYYYDVTDELIDIGSNISVKLAFASSGQQDSLWVLMQFFLLILNKTKAFIIIEEPEEDLFPEAQKYMTDMMSLIANINGNQIMITTHSPYMLTSLNNHIFAEQMGSRHQEKVSQIINPSLWISHQRVNAYYVDEGTIRSIMDEELHLVKAEEIDNTSKLINNEFSQLANVE